jgi:hypothetical protein
MSYYTTQLEKLQADAYNDITVKFFDSYGNTTHHLTLNNESISEIQDYLAAYEFNKQVAYLKQLIEGNPNDVKLLKEEYRELTGKQYRRS